MVPFRRDLRKSDIPKVNGLVQEDRTVSWTRNTRTEDNNIAVVKHLWIEAGRVITVSYLFHRVSPALSLHRGTIYAGDTTTFQRSNVAPLSSHFQISKMKGIFTILLSRFLYQIQLFLEDNFLKNRNFILKKKSSSIIDFWESWFLILKETFKDSRSRCPFPSFNGGKSNSKFLKNGNFYFNQKVIFNDPVVYFPWSPLYSRKIIFQKMEKAFFHFRKQYPNNEKKKERTRDSFI